MEKYDRILWPEPDFSTILRGHETGLAEFPHVSLEFLEELEDRFPNACPTPGDSIEKIWIDLGKQEVINFPIKNKQRKVYKLCVFPPKRHLFLLLSLSLLLRHPLPEETAEVSAIGDDRRDKLKNV